jgi:hypothetical protein
MSQGEGTMSKGNEKGWDLMKQYFFAWEGTTAKYLEAWMKSPLVLEPAGAWLSAMMKTKAMSDRAMAHAWGNAGLATKRDQERTLHAIHQLESRLIDLEERLLDLTAENAQLKAAKKED